MANATEVKKIIDYAQENHIPLFLDRNNFDGTPLQWACSYARLDGGCQENDYIEIVKLLLQAGANSHAESWDVPAPLICAARNCQVEMLPQDFQNDQWVAINPSTPLLLATAFGEKGIVRLLLDHGANPCATSNSRTALDIANTNAIAHNPSVYEPARETIPFLADAQKSWRLAHPE